MTLPIRRACAAAPLASLALALALAGCGGVPKGRCCRASRPAPPCRGRARAGREPDADRGHRAAERRDRDGGQPVRAGDADRRRQRRARRWGWATRCSLLGRELEASRAFERALRGAARLAGSAVRLCARDDRHPPAGGRRSEHLRALVAANPSDIAAAERAGRGPRPAGRPRGGHRDLPQGLAVVPAPWRCATTWRSRWRCRTGSPRRSTCCARLPRAPTRPAARGRTSLWSTACRATWALPSASAASTSPAPTCGTIWPTSRPCAAREPGLRPLRWHRRASGLGRAASPARDQRSARRRRPAPASRGRAAAPAAVVRPRRRPMPLPPASGPRPLTPALGEVDAAACRRGGWFVDVGSFATAAQRAGIGGCCVPGMPPRWPGWAGWPVPATAPSRCWSARSRTNRRPRSVCGALGSRCGRAAGQSELCRAVSRLGEAARSPPGPRKADCRCCNSCEHVRIGAARPRPGKLAVEPEGGPASPGPMAVRAGWRRCCGSESAVPAVSAEQDAARRAATPRRAGPIRPRAAPASRGSVPPSARPGDLPAFAGAHRSRLDPRPARRASTFPAERPRLPAGPISAELVHASGLPSGRTHGCRCRPRDRRSAAEGVLDRRRDRLERAVEAAGAAAQRLQAADGQDRHERREQSVLDRGGAALIGEQTASASGLASARAGVVSRGSRVMVILMLATTLAPQRQRIR